MLLEGFPQHLAFADVTQALGSLSGVRAVHDLHVWTITSGMVAMSCHLVVECDGPGCRSHDAILTEAREVLQSRFHIEHTTIQFESVAYHHEELVHSATGAIGPCARRLSASLLGDGAARWALAPLPLGAQSAPRRAGRAAGLLVALVAPAAPAMAGFARAARELGAPLVLVRPSGVAGERGPGEARDDGWFVEAALRAADEPLRLSTPLALLEPPRQGAVLPEQERVRAEIEAGFTGVSIAAGVDEAAGARDAALSAAEACRLDLGLEVVPLGGSAAHALEVARALAARGAPPSALRITGQEREAGALAAGIPGLRSPPATSRWRRSSSRSVCTS